MILSENGHFKVGVVNSTSTELMKSKTENPHKPASPVPKNFVPHQTKTKLYNSLKLSNDAYDPTNFICVEKDDAFKIKIEAVDKSQKKPPVFGAVLYLNGELVHGKKTMSHYCWYVGFKKGKGVFTEFVFQSPSMLPPGQDSQQVTQQPKRIGSDGKPLQFPGGKIVEDKHKGKTGTIILEFYRTKEFERPISYFNNIHHQKSYETHFSSEVAKKKFNENLTIKEGNTFHLPQNVYFKKKGFNQNENQHQQPQMQYQMNKRDQKYNMKNNYSQSSQNGGNYSSSQETNQSDYGSNYKRGGNFNQQPNQSNPQGRSRGQNGGFGNDRHMNNWDRPDMNQGFNNQYGQMNGGRYQSNQRNGQPHQHSQPHHYEATSKDHKILWEEGPVDALTIHYAEWTFLQLQKLVNIEQHYEHIQLIPKMLVESQECMTKCLKTIIRKIGQLHWSKCDEEFFKATGSNYRISDFFEFEKDQMKEFLQYKKEHFIVDDQGITKVVESNTTINSPIACVGSQKKKRTNGKNKNTCEVIDLDSE